MKKRKLGWKEIVAILIGLLVVVFLSVKEFKKSQQAYLRSKVTEVQAETLVPLVQSFYQTSGRMPLSLGDRLPDGQRFIDLLPNGECFANALTGHRTEPRFFDRIYKEADAGTIAIVQNKGHGYIVVYGEKINTVVFKLRL